MPIISPVYLRAARSGQQSEQDRLDKLTQAIPGFDTASILHAAQLAASRIRPDLGQRTTRRPSMFARRSLMGPRTDYVSNREARASTIGVNLSTAKSMLGGPY